MLTLEFISEVRAVLDDPGTTANSRYPNEMIVQNGDRQLRGLFRQMAMGTKDYSNFTYFAKASEASNPIKGVFEYRLPTWVENVVGVYNRRETAATQTSFSPYLWTANSVSFGDEISRFTQSGFPRWHWEGNYTLRLTALTTAPELAIKVVKRPAKMLAIKLSTASSAANKLYLPPTPIHGTYETEVGTYINTDMRVTDTLNTNATHYGETRRCIYSDAATIVSSTRQHELTFDAAFSTTPVAGDTLQTVLAIPDEHTRLLVLRTALSCFQKRGNQVAIAAIGAELAEETSAFKNMVTQRDRSGPFRYKPRLTERRPFDRERYGGGIY